MLKGTSWGAGKRPLLTVYRSLVRSVIEYGMKAHFFASPSLLKPLQKLQNDALRLCTGTLVITPVICLHHACNEMPLNIKHKFLCLKFKAYLLWFSYHPAEMITIRFAGWISGRIVSLQPDKDIQKLLSNGNRIRISETLSSIFWGFRLLKKVAHCTIIHLLSSEASFQPSAPWLRVCLWCNLWTVESCQVGQHESVPGVAR